LGIHVDFENQCNDNKNKINSGLSIAREKCDHLSQEALTTLDLQLRRRSQQLSTYETQVEELLDGVSESRGTVSTVFMCDNKLSDTAYCSLASIFLLSSGWPLPGTGKKELIAAKSIGTLLVVTVAKT
jgi:hypothetical protein